MESARVDDLVDDSESWPDPGRLILDGFIYDKIAGFTDVAKHLEWLSKGDHWEGEFLPQPYAQLAKVYREMGHERAARVVGMRQEQLMRQDARARGRITPDGSVGAAFTSVWADLRNGVLWFWDILLRFTVGYGRAPGRSLVVLTLLLLLATFIASRAWNEGSFAPNSDVMLVSDGWMGLADDPAVVNPAVT
ncbi:hypothetical protein [Defluviimonas sp. WL0075]|uniref:Uncharacterized protein n=1 Tax=Albidovulum sediminicola TaxID=2984331 RepID=A0ABT2Z3C5_9RHOB|nr:hypothetical protein [Defluviimonas sp. WL0075]MCV2865601.1 hypothetical protein [Defluviimonas sp. WL0075]